MCGHIVRLTRSCHHIRRWRSEHEVGHLLLLLLLLLLNLLCPRSSWMTMTTTRTLRSCGKYNRATGCIIQCCSFVRGDITGIIGIVEGWAKRLGEVR